MTSLLTNAVSMSTLRQMTQTGKDIAQTQSQASSGLRVGSASDGAAYWSIATKLKSQIGALSAVNDGLALTSSIADVTAAALNQVITTVQGMQNDLVAAQQAGVDLTSIQTDISAKQKQIMDTIDSANFNGVNWLKSGNSIDENAQAVDSFSTRQVRKADYDTGNSALGNVNHYYTVTNEKTGVIDQYFNLVHFTGPGAFLNTTPLQLISSTQSPPSNQTPPNSESYTLLTSISDKFLHTEKLDLNDIALFYPPSTVITTKIAHFPGQSDEYLGTTTTQSTPGGIIGSNLVGVSNTSGQNVNILNFDIRTLDSANLLQVVSSVSGTLSRLQTAGAVVGSIQNRVQSSKAFNGALSDAITSGVGSLQDADMNIVSTRLQALQTQQQLQTQSLAIANQNNTTILKLFA